MVSVWKCVSKVDGYTSYEECAERPVILNECEITEYVSRAELEAARLRVGELEADEKVHLENSAGKWELITKLRNENERLREALESARGWVVTHTMQTYSKAANSDLKLIDAALGAEDRGSE